MIRNLVFDLDGTLFDSLPSIERSARFAIERVLPEVPPPDLAHLVGPPIATMFAMLWPDMPQEKIAALLAEFRTVYDSSGCIEAVPYPGVSILLPELHRNGFRLFVLTNKPEKPTHAILKHHDLLPLFTEIASPDSAVPFSSKPDGAGALAVRHDLIASETALIGDGRDDSESACTCGFHFIYASYGYGHMTDPQPKSFTRLDFFPNLKQILQLSSFQETIPQ